jgi:two-component system response regulator PilR (NtrC family)
MVANHLFREDLYYRVSVIPISVPPLGERREDISQLAHHFLKKYAAAAQKDILKIHPDSITALRSYSWPGNVRQLENAIERAVAMEITHELNVDLEPSPLRAHAAVAGAGNGFVTSVPAEGMDFGTYVAGIERSLIESALQQAGGVQTRAAELLKVSYRSFRHLLKKYDI